MDQEVGGGQQFEFHLRSLVWLGWCITDLETEEGVSSSVELTPGEQDRWSRSPPRRGERYYLRQLWSKGSGLGKRSSGGGSLGSERLLQFAPSDRSKRELGWQTFVLETASDLVNASEKKSSSLVFDTLQTWKQESLVFSQHR